jgi:dihydropteroate synthase
MRLRLGDRIVDTAERPLVMGILNTTPDSVSDAERYLTLDAQVARARELVEAGADIVDVGGESGRTDIPPVSEDEEVERVVPLVRALAADGVVVSVDTWKPAVARAAADAGAAMLNDVSGLRSPELAQIAAGSGAALVLMHTRADPKTERFPPYDDVVADVEAMLRDLIHRARSLGVPDDQLVIDPGPDFAKTPEQSVEVLRRLGELRALGRPLLLAVSRKYFLGAITGRPPLERLGGTLAALGHGVDNGAAILRVHDVAEAVDYLRVRAVLRGQADVPPDFDRDDERLKWVEPLP